MNREEAVLASHWEDAAHVVVGGSGLASPVGVLRRARTREESRCAGRGEGAPSWGGGAAAAGHATE
jgi:hypothetical protein